MRPFVLATLLPQIPAHAAQCPSSREDPARSPAAASRHPSPGPALVPSRRSTGASPLPGITGIALYTRSVVLQNTVGVRNFSALDQIENIGLHISRRYAPRFVGQKHCALPRFRNRGPELPVKNLSVRFHEKTGFGHLLFVRAENFTEVLDLLIHPVQHLPNGVYLNFAFFVTFQR